MLDRLGEAAEDYAERAEHDLALAICRERADRLPWNLDTLEDLQCALRATGARAQAEIVDDAIVARGIAALNRSGFDWNRSTMEWHRRDNCPFLRAWARQAMRFERMGYVEEATRIFEQLARAAPSDGLGARYEALRLDADAARWGAVRKRLERMKDDTGGGAALVRLLAAAAADPQAHTMPKDIERIVADNALTIAVILDDEDPETPMRYSDYTANGFDEASYLWGRHHEACRATLTPPWRARLEEALTRQLSRPKHSPMFDRAHDDDVQRHRMNSYVAGPSNERPPRPERSASPGAWPTRAERHASRCASSTAAQRSRSSTTTRATNNCASRSTTGARKSTSQRATPASRGRKASPRTPTRPRGAYGDERLSRSHPSEQGRKRTPRRLGVGAHPQPCSLRRTEPARVRAAGADRLTQSPKPALGPQYRASLPVRAEAIERFELARHPRFLLERRQHAARLEKAVQLACLLRITPAERARQLRRLPRNAVELRTHAHELCAHRFALHEPPSHFEDLLVIRHLSYSQNPPPGNTHCNCGESPPGEHGNEPPSCPTTWRPPPPSPLPRPRGNEPHRTVSSYHELPPAPPARGHTDPPDTQRERARTTPPPRDCPEHPRAEHRGDVPSTRDAQRTVRLTAKKREI